MVQAPWTTGWPDAAVDYGAADGLAESAGAGSTMSPDGNAPKQRGSVDTEPSSFVAVKRAQNSASSGTSRSAVTVFASRRSVSTVRLRSKTGAAWLPNPFSSTTSVGLSLGLTTAVNVHLPFVACQSPSRIVGAVGGDSGGLGGAGGPQAPIAAARSDARIGDARVRVSRRPS